MKQLIDSAHVPFTLETLSVIKIFIYSANSPFFYTLNLCELFHESKSVIAFPSLYRCPLVCSLALASHLGGQRNNTAITMGITPLL